MDFDPFDPFDLFPSLVIMNVLLWTQVYDICLSLCCHFFGIYISRNGIIESYGNSVFAFLMSTVLFSTFYCFIKHFLNIMCWFCVMVAKDSSTLEVFSRPCVLMTSHLYFQPSLSLELQACIIQMLAGHLHVDVKLSVCKA